MTTATDTMQQRYFDYPQAARYYGLSEQTIRRLVNAGKLKAYRPTGGRKVLFDRTELDQLVRGEAPEADPRPHQEEATP